MAYQLRCTVNHDGASPAYLRERDVMAAWGSSELLRPVSDWATSKATFNRQNGISRRMVIEKDYQVTTAGPAINRLVADYLAAVAS